MKNKLILLPLLIAQPIFCGDVVKEDPNAPDKNGDTALMRALKTHQPTDVSFGLLIEGASPIIRNKEGVTPKALLKIILAEKEEQRRKLDNEITAYQFLLKDFEYYQRFPKKAGSQKSAS